MPASVRRAAACLLLVLAPATSTTAGSAVLPSELRLDGHRLRIAGRATRSVLLGIIDIYTVAIYTASGKLQPNPHVSRPVAARVHVLHDSPDDGIPANWKNELAPALKPAELARLHRAYVHLKAGDVVQVGYTPRIGTVLAIDAHRVLQTPDARLMQAFLDMWLGTRAASTDLKKALLSGQQ